MIRQFDICRLRKRTGGAAATLVVVLQHNELSDIATVIVAPLTRDLPAERRPRLHPWIDVPEGQAMLAVERMAAIDRREIAETVGSATKQADEIKRALDIAFYGF